jgi:hypothetical protein
LVWPNFRLAIESSPDRLLFIEFSENPSGTFLFSFGKRFRTRFWFQTRFGQNRENVSKNINSETAKYDMRVHRFRCMFSNALRIADDQIYILYPQPVSSTCVLRTFLGRSAPFIWVVSSDCVLNLCSVRFLERFGAYLGCTFILRPQLVSCWSVWIVLCLIWAVSLVCILNLSPAHLYGLPEGDRARGSCPGTFGQCLGGSPGRLPRNRLLLNQGTGRNEARSKTNLVAIIPGT